MVWNGSWYVPAPGGCPGLFWSTYTKMWSSCAPARAARTAINNAPRMGREVPILSGRRPGRRSEPGRFAAREHLELEGPRRARHRVPRDVPRDLAVAEHLEAAALDD